MKNHLRKSFIWLSILILVVSLVCMSCGSKKESTKVVEKPTQAPVLPTKTSEPTKVPATATKAPSPTKSLAVGSLVEVQNAVIHIVASGTFDNPTGTANNSAGEGTGFIIDPSGIAVTNNHVVTGGAQLIVLIGDDTSTLYKAKVLGVSECLDLAVIDLDGEGFPYLEWREGAIQTGLEVYAFGFPLSRIKEDNYTGWTPNGFTGSIWMFTKGIVSKEQADGNTYWASVDHMIVHDITIKPGLSGGPLVDNKGKVVGVNYPGNQDNQYFAIRADLVKVIVGQLKSGNIDSFGLNGSAFVLPDGSFSGIWIYSVTPGSPADKAGLKGGDILTTIEGSVLAADGTMKDYCNILQSHTSNETLGVQVYRYMTNELLEGQINGRTLAVTQSNVMVTPVHP
jgi:serine protease Do